MAKKNTRASPEVVKTTKQKQETVIDTAPIADARFPAWLSDFKIQAIIVSVLAFLFYCNTFSNEYARDDTMVIVKNEYVYEGLAGLSGIFTKDAFDSYYKQFNSSNQLAGGRYRPLSIATFAVEQQFLGAVPEKIADSVVANTGRSGPQEKKLVQDMHVRHIFNVLLFTLSVVVLLYFLRYIVLRSNPVMALIAAIIFAVHPIHTEVVANVKSRDEIMSLLFICLTFIFAFKYQEKKHKWLLGMGMFSYFLAFLSKEYAIGLVVLLPLSFYCFNKFSLSKSRMASLPYMGVMVLYLIIRLQVVAPMSESANTDIINNPYAFASGSEKLATQILTMLYYLKLLVFPNPLLSDYSYNTIPYRDFTSLLVWLSLAVNLALIWGFFYFIKRKNYILSFAIAFYLVNLLLVCNIIFNIGGTMGERLIYHSSVGFCIAAAYLLYKGMEVIKPARIGKFAMGGIIVLLIFLCGFKTIARNRDWNNDYTLFTEDIKAAPENILENAGLSQMLINNSGLEKDEKKKNEDLYTGIKLLGKTISLDSEYTLGYLFKSIAYYRLGDPDSCKYYIDKVRLMSPNNPQIPEMYYYTGLAYYAHKQYAQAVAAWQFTLKLNPNYTPAQNALRDINNSMQQPK